MHFWLSTIGHYLVTRALNRALNGVFGGDARGTKSKKKTSTIGTCLVCGVEAHLYLKRQNVDHELQTNREAPLGRERRA